MLGRIDREVGQALVEFALIVPIFLFMCLGALEAGFLVGTQLSQSRATGVVADYAARHPGDESWHAVANTLGLQDCEVTVTEEPYDMVKAGATCHYTPHVTNGLGWSGLPISTEAYAATDTGPAPTPTPTATPEPSPSPS